MMGFIITLVVFGAVGFACWWMWRHYTTVPKGLGSVELIIRPNRHPRGNFDRWGWELRVDGERKQGGSTEYKFGSRLEAVRYARHLKQDEAIYQFNSVEPDKLRELAARHPEVKELLEQEGYWDE